MKKDKDIPERKAQYIERMTQFDQMLAEIAYLQQTCTYSYVTDMNLVLAIEAEYDMSDEELMHMPEIQYQMSLALEEKNINAPSDETDNCGFTVEKTIASLRVYIFSEKGNDILSKFRALNDHAEVGTDLPTGTDDYILSNRRSARLSKGQNPSTSEQLNDTNNILKYDNFKEKVPDGKVESPPRSNIMKMMKKSSLKQGKPAILGSTNSMQDLSHKNESGLGQSGRDKNSLNNSGPQDLSSSAEKLKLNHHFSGMVINTGLNSVLSPTLKTHSGIF